MRVAGPIGIILRPCAAPAIAHNEIAAAWRAVIVAIPDGEHGVAADLALAGERPAHATERPRLPAVEPMLADRQPKQHRCSGGDRGFDANDAVGRQVDDAVDPAQLGFFERLAPGWPLARIVWVRLSLVRPGRLPADAKLLERRDRYVRPRAGIAGDAIAILAGPIDELR